MNRQHGGASRLAQTLAPPTDAAPMELVLLLLVGFYKYVAPLALSNKQSRERVRSDLCFRRCGETT